MASRAASVNFQFGRQSCFQSHADVWVTEMEHLRRVRHAKRHGAENVVPLSVNEGAQVNGAVVGATKLPESCGRISISGFICKFCTVSASEGGRGDRAGETDRVGKAITCERSEGVQTAGPITGDARRTSFAEGNVDEGEALDMT